MLFALSQSFIGAGTQLAYGIGPLMVIAVTGSASLAGLTVGLFGVSRFLVSYPVGKITDTYGRKPGILFGRALAHDRHVRRRASRCSRAAPSAWRSAWWCSPWASAPRSRLRVAATDMYPPRHARAGAGLRRAPARWSGIMLSPLVMGLAE